jgi:hypothetical protein
MYQITYTLPASNETQTNLFKMDAGHQESYDIIQRNFYGVPTLKTGGIKECLKLKV